MRNDGPVKVGNIPWALRYGVLEDTLGFIAQYEGAYRDGTAMAKYARS